MDIGILVTGMMLIVMIFNLIAFERLSEEDKDKIRPYFIIFF